MGTREDDEYWNDKYDGHTHCLHWADGIEECCICDYMEDEDGEEIDG